MGHAATYTTTNTLRLLRTREKVLEINDCTLTDYPEFLLHHPTQVLQLSNDLLLRQFISYVYCSDGRGCGQH
jgi:hypothetical protein